MRELENTIERAVVLTTGSTITRDVVTVDPAARVRTGNVPSLKLRQNVEWMECETIRRALGSLECQAAGSAAHGNQPAGTLYYLAKYPFIDPPGAPLRPETPRG